MTARKATAKAGKKKTATRKPATKKVAAKKVVAKKPATKKAAAKKKAAALQPLAPGQPVAIDITNLNGFLIGKVVGIAAGEESKPEEERFYEVRMEEASIIRAILSPIDAKQKLK